MLNRDDYVSEVARFNATMLIWNLLRMFSEQSNIQPLKMLQHKYKQWIFFLLVYSDFQISSLKKTLRMVHLLFSIDQGVISFDGVELSTYNQEIIFFDFSITQFSSGADRWSCYKCCRYLLQIVMRRNSISLSK